MNRPVELLPDEYLARPVYRRRFRQWVLVTIALSSVVCLFAYARPSDSERLERELVPLRQRAEQLEGLGNRFALLKNELEDTVARQNVVDDLLDAPEWSYLLNDLCKATNNELWIVELTLSDNDVDGVRGSRLQIRGVAPSNAEISRFTSRLSASPHFRDIQLESSRESTTDEENVKVEFGISGIAL